MTRSLPDPQSAIVRNYVEVPDLKVTCAFPMRHAVRSASDTCQGPATTAIRVPPNGVAYYRCEEHRGMVDPINHGQVLDRVVRRAL